MINIRTITYNLTNEFLNEEYKTIENCLEMWKKINTILEQHELVLHLYSKFQIYINMNFLIIFAIKIILNGFLFLLTQIAKI